MKHQEGPVYWTRRHGCWTFCGCGWGSGAVRTAAGASIRWALHVANDPQVVA